MLLVVADQIVKREPVMAGDEVHAGVWTPAAVVVEVAAACDASGELGNEAAVGPPEPADRITIAAVPLRPADREIADLIPAFAQVPRLGNELHLRDDGS